MRQKRLKLPPWAQNKDEIISDPSAVLNFLVHGKTATPRQRYAVIRRMNAKDRRLIQGLLAAFSVQKYLAFSNPDIRCLKHCFEELKRMKCGAVARVEYFHPGVFEIMDVVLRDTNRAYDKIMGENLFELCLKTCILLKKKKKEENV